MPMGSPVAFASSRNIMRNSLNLLSVLLHAAGAAKPAAKPNIVFILADDLDDTDEVQSPYSAEHSFSYTGTKAMDGRDG